MEKNNRVGRIKYFLLFAPYILVLIPIILSIVLFVVIGKQNQQLDSMEAEIARLSENQTGIVQKIGDVNSFSSDLKNQIDSIKEDVNSIEHNENSNVNESGRDVNMWPKKVYLTFDDGPSVNTEKILDILDSYGVKGNFFVVGTTSDNLKQMYKRIVNEGHVLAMHSYSHKYSEIYTSKDAFIEDLDRISDLLYEETGVRPTIYRFPGGSSNNVSKVPMKELIEVLDERGIVYYDWNILSGDATNPILPTEDIISNSLENIGYYEEAMILFHDLSNKTTTVEALPQIIESLLEEGITIAPIDETTISIKHYTNK